jgi:hypothetical protein
LSNRLSADIAARVVVIELHPNPVAEVHVRALLAVLQDGTESAVGTALPPVPFPTTVFAPIEGKSPITIARNAGVVAPPEVGPAQNVLALSLALVIAIVPEVVMGFPETEKIAGAVRSTEVTVPVPAAEAHEGTPEEFSDRTLVPLALPVRLVQPDGPLYITVPALDP